MDFENIYAVSADFLIKNLADEMFRGAKLIGKIERFGLSKNAPTARAVSADIFGTIWISVKAFLNRIEDRKN